MGDETIQFASRFSSAVSDLEQLAGSDPQAKLSKRHGSDPASAVRAALDAVEAVYGTGTQAVRNWPEQRRRVLAQVASMREALDRSGVDDRLRGMARALVELIESRSTGG
jgi:hypothetical protein